MEAAKQVFARLGPGWTESVYHCAMEVELRLSGVLFSTEMTIPVQYKNHGVGAVRADLVLLNPGTQEPMCVIELKATNHPPNDAEMNQARRYASLLGIADAMVINFGMEELQVAVC